MAIYYISPTGNDTTGTGAIGTPWATISKANTSAASGDTVNIAAGTYAWTAFSLAKNITWVGVNNMYGKPNVFVDGAGGTITWTLSNSGGTQSFSNIQFQNIVKTTATTVISISSGGTINFTNCRFTNMGLYNSGASSGYCLFFTTSSTITFNYCGFWNLYTATFANEGARICDSDSAGAVYVFNNCAFYHDATMTSALAGLFRRNGAALTVTTKNSIFVSTTSISYSAPTVSNSSYSCFYNISSSPSGTGNITTDPLFVDGANGNFNLRVNPIMSPAIDTGTTP
jgi:hypothetical protein